MILGRRFFTRNALGAVCFALGSCATTNLAPIGVGGTALPTDEDEKQLWRNADQIERRIDNGAIRYKNPQLDAYLTGVAQRLLPRDAQASGLAPRVKVIQDPLLNAFALPNGAIYFHTGILARMENEDQLTVVLGHELTHVTHRHAIKQMRSLQNQTDIIGVIRVLLPGLEGLTGGIGALWTLTSTSGYSKELETEADEQGLQLMVTAGYDPKQAPAVIILLEEDLDGQKVKEPFFYGTHPRLEDRINNYRRLLDTQYAKPASAPAKVGTEEFLGGAEGLLLDNAALDIGLGRLKTARSAIDRHLKRHAQAPRAHFLLGEIDRRTPGDRSTQQAIAEYEEAAREDSSYADPHRELGFLYRFRGSDEQARAEFERYLALNPSAVDAPIIRGYLKQPAKAGGKPSTGGKSVD